MTIIVIIEIIITTIILLGIIIIIMCVRIITWYLIEVCSFRCYHFKSTVCNDVVFIKFAKCFTLPLFVFATELPTATPD